MERTILHSDLNNFYASVECLYNPEIRPYPVAVCGNAEARHGIILAKNQLAKNFGVTTGESIWLAKQKCPNLLTVSAHFPLYLKFSKMAKDIYSEYTDQTESFGIDESWLDVTGSIGLFGSGEKIANEIRNRIYSELGVTASVGVSFNKIFAKLGSDMKKPNATTVITRDNFKNTVWPLPASDLLYVGRSTSKKLSKINIRTIGDLANADNRILCNYLGKWGNVLHHFANGLDNSPVSSNGEESYIKSVGNSTTCPRDLTMIEDIKSVFYMLSESVAARLRSHGLKCTTIQIYVRDKDLVSVDRQGMLDFPSFLSSEIAEKALEIFIKKYDLKFPIRSLGVRATNLIKKDATVQLNIFTDIEKRDKLEKMEETIDEIRERYGYHSIKKGILFVDKKLTRVNAREEHVIHPVGYFNKGMTY